MKRHIVAFWLFSTLIAACSSGLPSSPESTSTDLERSTTAEMAPEATVEAPAGTESNPEASEPGADSESAQHPAAQLVASFVEPPQADGDVLILYGQVVDSLGNPVAQSVVEIWQTDADGIYDHPGDPDTDGRDTNFQFYGSAATDEDGWYAFRTIAPGRYEPRPRHIHFKLKQDGETLLTSQFYFSDDVAEVQDEGMFQAVGESGDLLLLQLVQGDGQLLANGRIVVDTGVGSGTLTLTPSQGEGPYYPVVAVSEYDNDLVTLP